MLDEFFRNYEFGEFTALDVLANLTMSLLLAIITSYVYRRTHTGYSYSRSFVVTLVSVAMTITMIMMIIGNYWVLSLGLIGALSVIRFRSAIKDPKDIAYLFLCIAIGLACSTGNYTISVIGTLFINAALYLMHVFRFGAASDSGHSLAVRLNEDGTGAERLVEGMSNLGVEPVFRSYVQIGPGIGEYVYTVDLGRISAQRLLQFLKEGVAGVEHVSIVAPESNLEV